jgi:hypothetical protein
MGDMTGRPADPRSSRRAWARIAIHQPDGSVTRTWLEGPGAPDMETVEGLAWLAQETRRAGGWVQLEHLCPDLAELLDLSGLRREVGGEPE